MLTITLLGTAAMTPLPDRALASALLSCAGRSILFDCGEGTQVAARRAGVSLMKTDLVALTHFHGDHIFGLPGLLQSLGVQGRTEPLYFAGPKGLRDVLMPIVALAGGQPYEMRLVEIPEGEGIPLNLLHPAWPELARLTPYPTKHRCPSWAYAFELGRAGRFRPERAKALGVPIRLWSKLQAGEAVQCGGSTIEPNQVLGESRRGLKFAVSGDTAACDGLESAARDADLFLCEATYGEDSQANLASDYGHMTFAQAAALAQKANAHRLWLTHYSQRIENPQDYLSNAQRHYPEATCGEDGMQITLNFED